MAKILVAEDDPHLTKLVADWLDLDHHTVETTSDGTDALNRLKVYKYDVIILVVR